MDKFEMPILPLTALEDLPTVMASFQRNLHPPQALRATLSPTRALLPYCTILPPLSEHETNVLSDICSSLRDLADKATTAGGQAMIRDYLGAQSGNNAASFWLKEYPAT